MREIGECIVTRLTDPERGDCLRVNKADPLVRMSAELLDEINVLTARDEPRFSSFDGEVLTINSRDRRVIYRLIAGSYDPYTDTYLMEWPD